MNDEDRIPSDPAKGGHTNPQTEPPVAPPAAPANKSTSQLLLTAAGFASLAALLTFLLGCLGKGSELMVDLGVLLAVLAIILDAVGTQTMGGHVKPQTEPPVAPPAMAYVTAATIATALGLLALVLECVIERDHGAVALVGFLLLLLGAVFDFMAVYNVPKGSAARS